jgi:hypothetical protein
VPWWGVGRPLAGGTAPGGRRSGTSSTPAEGQRDVALRTAPLHRQCEGMAVVPPLAGACGSLLAEQLAEPGWQRGVGDVGALPDEHDIL